MSRVIITSAREQRIDHWAGELAAELKASGEARCLTKLELARFNNLEELTRFSRAAKKLGLALENGLWVWEK